MGRIVNFQKIMHTTAMRKRFIIFFWKSDSKRISITVIQWPTLRPKCCLALYTRVSVIQQPLCFLMATSENDNQFSQLFHCSIPKKSPCVPLREASTPLWLRCYTISWNLQIQNNRVAKATCDGIISLTKCQLLAIKFQQMCLVKKHSI